MKTRTKEEHREICDQLAALAIRAMENAGLQVQTSDVHARMMDKISKALRESGCAIR